jgi:ABC-2 type transport system permease protein
MNQPLSIINKKYLFLIQQFTITDFKLRYSQSILGYLWSLLNPLMMFGVLYFVFSVFMRFGSIPHYPVYLLSGIILWNYFSEATRGGMDSLLTKSSLLNKISFPRIIIPLSSLFTSTLTLFINLCILSLFMVLSRVAIYGSVWISVALIFELVFLSFSISLILSSFFLRFRDLVHIWTVLLQVGFWATPIIYPVEIVPEKYRFLVRINPMARIINEFRLSVIYGQGIAAADICYTLILIAILFVVGLILFQWAQRYFPEWL